MLLCNNKHTLERQTQVQRPLEHLGLPFNSGKIQPRSVAHLDVNAHIARAAFIEIDGVRQPGPVPRFSKTPAEVAHGPVPLAAHNASALGAYFDSSTMFLRSFHAYGLPLTVLLDPRGREVGRAYGAQEWDAPDAVAYLKEITRGE